MKSLYNRVINTYGIDAQKWMVVEECAELLDAIAKFRRGRATKEDVVTELADVHIMVEQMASFYGWDEFKAEKERKLTNLRERIDNDARKNKELEKAWRETYENEKDVSDVYDPHPF